MFYQNITTIVILALLSACGGGGSSESVTPVAVAAPAPVATPTTYTGVFIDSPVENLRYSTESESGTTNAAGEFNYQIDEAITFSIGDIEFPPVMASDFVTPLNIFSTEDINQTSVVNMLRLLQSLDIDGDANNGIQLSEVSHELAASIIVDFTSDEFEQQVADLVSMSNGYYAQLISVEQAVYHFQLSLENLNGQTMAACEKTHAKIGYNGLFSTLAHNVAGQATIIDDCTIEISNFDYDGGGPEVYFYGAKDHQYGSNEAFAFSLKLNGVVHQNETLTIRLPDNKTLDDLTGISVWCVEFGADFGNMEFTP